MTRQFKIALAALAAGTCILFYLVTFIPTDDREPVVQAQQRIATKPPVPPVTIATGRISVKD